LIETFVGIEMFSEVFGCLLDEVEKLWSEKTIRNSFCLFVCGFVCRVVANYVLKEALGNGCLQVMLSKWFLYYKQLEINGYRI
jgi:hypothetical protein